MVNDLNQEKYTYRKLVPAVIKVTVIRIFLLTIIKSRDTSHLKCGREGA